MDIAYACTFSWSYSHHTPWCVGRQWNDGIELMMGSKDIIHVMFILVCSSHFSLLMIEGKDCWCKYDWAHAYFTSPCVLGRKQFEFTPRTISLVCFCFPFPFCPCSSCAHMMHTFHIHIEREQKTTTFTRLRVPPKMSTQTPQTHPTWQVEISNQKSETPQKMVP